MRLVHTTLGWFRPLFLVRSSSKRSEPADWIKPLWDETDKQMWSEPASSKGRATDIRTYIYIFCAPSVLHLCTLVRLDWRGDSDTTGIGTLAGLYMLREILIN